MYIVVTRGVVLVLVCCLPGKLLVQTTEYNDHSIYDIFWVEFFMLNTMIWFMRLCMILVCSRIGKILI